MGIETSTNIVTRLLEINPELKTQVEAYAGMSLVTLRLCMAMNEKSGLEAIKAALVIGASLYREWILSKGVKIQEVEGKLCNR